MSRLPGEKLIKKRNFILLSYCLCILRVIAFCKFNFEQIEDGEKLPGEILLMDKHMAGGTVSKAAFPRVVSYDV